MTLPRRTKVALAIAAGLVAVPALTLVGLLNLDWNRVKPWLNARTSEALGRPFEIKGSLALHWEQQPAGPAAQYHDWRGMLPWPHLIAQDIVVGNPPTLANLTAASSLARIREIDILLNPLALLDKTIAISLLRFDTPAVTLLRNADGANNWTFNKEDRRSPWTLNIQRVIFSKGNIHLSDAIKHAELDAAIDTIDTNNQTAPAGGPPYGVRWQLQGRFNGEAIRGGGQAGAVLSLQHQTTPYPIMAHLRMGNTMIDAEGTLTKPTDLAALDMRLKVSGVSMARLYALTGTLLPETPPFATEGHLIGQLGAQGGHWTYEKFSGKFGASDVSGTLDYQSRHPRALVSGTVVSHVLHFADLAPLIGADSNASKAARGVATVQPANKVLPVEPFKTARWTSINADIRYRAEKILRQQALPINLLTTHVQLQDGVLGLMPLNFGMAGGTLDSTIVLDGSGKAGKNAIKATMKVSARHLKLKQLFPTLQPLQASIGEINGDASLSATGDSVASLLGGSNGEIKTLINQGTVSKLLLEEIGLNIGSVVVTQLVGDKQVKLNCMATDFGVTNGVMQARSFIIDTDDAILNVSGNINLTQEQLNLTIKPNSKGLRVFSLRAPLYVHGSFKQPSVTVDKGVLAMRAGGAIALATLAPLAALIPLINTGPGQNSDCAKLLVKARETPQAPAPGQPYRRKVKPN
jgi:uncharacterized protein involved in outer membrane biogenesis